VAELLSLFDVLMAVPEPTPALTGAPVIAYRIPVEGRSLAAGWRNRAAANIEAIRLAKALTASGMPATADDLALLAQYVGWGATDLAQNVFPVEGRKVGDEWKPIATDLATITSAAERRAMSLSTQYAHYTPVIITQAMWTAIRRLGFAGGRVLEPGCGSGLFMAAAPEDLELTWTGVENDPTTAMIAQLLQPQARIIAEDFARIKPRNPFDLAIGNPPFSRIKIKGQGHAGRMSLRLHDYFIARSLELVQDGGLAAFVVSHGTMDKANPKARNYIGSLADLIGAIRLPQGAMRREAGTDVVVDLLFFRRNERPTSAAEWRDLAEVTPSVPGEKPMLVNAYFAAHPEMVLGEHAWTTSPLGPVYTVKHPNPTDIAAELEAAIDRIAAPATLPIVKRPTLLAVPALAPSSAPAPASSTSSLKLTHDEIRADAEAYTLKEGSYAVDRSDRLCVYYDGRLEPVPIKGDALVPGMSASQVRKIRAFIRVRNALRAVITAQVAGIDSAPAQARLLKAYRAFTEEFGPFNLTKTSYRVDPETSEETPIHRRPNIGPLADDPDCWLVASIENYDMESGLATPGAVFTERVILPPATRTIETPADALAASLDQRGRVDIDYIAGLLELPRTTAIEHLGDAIYLLPNTTDEWVTADAYLSGQTRVKLAEARAAAAHDPIFARNVAALEEHQPKDLAPGDISARLGAPWIPNTDIEQFVLDVMKIKTTIRHEASVAAWNVNLRDFSWRPNATSEWGTDRRHAGELLQEALNGSLPQVFDTDPDDKRILNPVATEAAREKFNKINDAFAAWIWTDPERTERLVRLYNDHFNNIVPRHFDGKHLQIPNAAKNISLRDHQKRVVWRIITSGNTYMAHAVGAGKTYSMAAACMKQRQLGLVRKPMILVPGHCLAQFSREFMQLFPLANVLVADEAAFEKSKRDRFIARATTGNWDAIIITHSAFKFIPSPTTFEEAMIGEQLAMLEATEQSLKHNGGGDDRMTRKRLALRMESLKRRLDSLKGRKDDMVTIAEMGVDQLLIDEGQVFRKLDFQTSCGSIRGIDSSGSQRSWDLYVKSKYIESINPGRAIIMASGTPITNTVGELYTVQRFLNENALKERNVHEFDAWRATFGELTTDLELQPGGGYKQVVRFAAFANLPELIAMFREYADVVQRADLRDILDLPKIASGARQIVTGVATDSFKAYQETLRQRLDALQNKTGAPRMDGKNDIILSIITDGRHAAIDVRLVDPSAENEPNGKLNVMIDKIFTIWRETSENAYTTNGKPDKRHGATQMIFSDLGTEAVAEKRGFSAYTWIRQSLIARGVPANEIVFMQDLKTSAQKQACFNAMNAGEIRILIGSTLAMGTGVNAQKRLVAIHHLDVPWLPSDIEQREGRGERQGNQNPEIGLYAYATPGSMDGPGWQILQRKSAFISAAMAGDTSIRRIDDVGAQTNSFALAKAIASGNPLLLTKAGLEMEVGRLERLRRAHNDDQWQLRRTVQHGLEDIARIEADLLALRADLDRAVSTRGDDFALHAYGKTYTNRGEAGAMLLGYAHTQPFSDHGETYATVGTIGGFDLLGRTRLERMSGKRIAQYGVGLSNETLWPEASTEIETPIGLIRSLEHMVASLPDKIARLNAQLVALKRRVAEAQPRVGRDWDYESELQEKCLQLAQIDAELVRQTQEDEAARSSAARPAAPETSTDTDAAEQDAA
jgi:N12 class adenine-specific DNA methylase